MLPLPSASENTQELADWLELNALVSRAGQVSLDDMRNALKVGALGYGSGALPFEKSGRLEELAAEVWTEIEKRYRRSRRAYPFRLQGSSLERTIRSDRRLSSTYAFCLMLSFLPWEDKRLPGYFPDRMFEEVSCLVAQRYVCGIAVRFGWPRVRSVLPSRFSEAVAKVCVRIGEGVGYRTTNATGGERDAGLDVVAWRPIDERSGKLLLFGACATGRNWEDKLNELQPKNFCDKYLQSSFIQEPAKAFFTPRVVSDERWQTCSISAGMLFDRCRVSKIVPQLPSRSRHGDVKQWMQVAMERVLGDK